MNPIRSIFSSLFAELASILCDAFEGFRNWWKENDMGGEKHRTGLLEAAPRQFAQDRERVVVDSDPLMLLCFETDKFVLGDRASGRQIDVSEPSLERYRRRGLRGLRRDWRAIQKGLT